MYTPRLLKPGRSATHGVLLCIVAVLFLAVAGCHDEQLTRMEDNQIKLHAMVAANAQQIATVSSQVHTGTEELRAGIQDLDEDTKQVAAGVQAAQEQQIELHNTIASGQEGLNERMTQLDKNQKALAGEVAGVAGVTSRTAADLATLADRHAAMFETIRANQLELTGGIETVVANQQRLDTGLSDLHDADKALAGDIAALADRQDTMFTTMQDYNGRLNEQLAALTAGHERLDGDLGNVHGLMQVLAADVAGIASEQTVLQTALQDQSNALTDKLTIAEQDRQDLRAGIERVTNTTSGTAADVTAMAAGQAALRETIGDNHEEVTGRVESLSQNQQNLQADLGTLDGKVERMASDSAAAASSLEEKVAVTRDVLTGQIAASIRNQQEIQTSVQDLDAKAQNLAKSLDGMSSEQKSFRKAMAGNHDAVMATMAGLSGEQMAMRKNLNSLHDKADTARADTAAAQKAIAKAMENHQKALASQGAKLAESQQAMRSQLDVLTATTGQLGIDVLALASGQTDLQSMMQANVAGLNDRADRLAADLGSLAERQTALGRQIEAGNEALVTQVSTVAGNQQHLKTGLQSLDGRMGRVSADVAAVATAQQKSHEALTARNDEIAGRLARAAERQQAVEGSLDVLVATSGQTAMDVIELADGQAQLRQSVAAGNEAIAGHAATLADSQQTIHKGIQTLDQIARRTAEDILTMATAHDVLHNTLAVYREETGIHLTALADQQSFLQEQVDTLTATAGQTNLDVIALHDRQAELAKAVEAGAADLSERTDALTTEVRNVTAGQDAMTAQMSTVASNQQVLRNDIGTIDEKAEMMAAGQQTTQAQLDVLTATAGQTSLDVIALHDRQAELTKAVEAGAADLNKRTDNLTTEVRNVAAGQDAMTAQMSTVASNQQVLRNDLGTIDKKAETMAAGLGQLASGQTSLYQAVNSLDEAADQRIAKIAVGQETTQAQLDVLTATAGQTSLDVITMHDRQAELAKAVEAGAAELNKRTDDLTSEVRNVAAGQEAITAHVSTVAANQQVLRNDIGTVEGEAERMTAGLDRLASEQASLHQALNEQTDQVARVAAGQQATQTQIDVLTATAGQTSLDVIAMQDRQAELARTVQTSTEDLGKRTDKLAAELSAVVAGQGAMAAALDQHDEAVSTKVARMTDSQKKMQGALDVVIGTTGQTAKDVLEVAARQEDVRTAVRDYAEAADGRAARLSENQQAIQNNLDIITATAGQVALDVIALGNRQEALEQAVQANRRVFAEKLADLSEDRQGWRQQLDTAQARVETMAKNVTTLEERIGVVRDAVQTALDDVTKLVDTTGQERAQFEARISQEMQAMVEAVAQLRQMQDLLQKQMIQVHKSTESQTEDLKAAIEQIGQPAAEVQVSDAAKVEAAAQTGE